MYGLEIKVCDECNQFLFWIVKNIFSSFYLLSIQFFVFYFFSPLIVLFTNIKYSFNCSVQKYKILLFTHNFFIYFFPLH